VSTQKLLQLAYGMLQEAATGTELSAYQIFYTVRSVFELFCIVVPTFHKRELQNLPQVAGRSNGRLTEENKTDCLLTNIMSIV